MPVLLLMWYRSHTEGADVLSEDHIKYNVHNRVNVTVEHCFVTKMSESPAVNASLAQSGPR